MDSSHDDDYYDIVHLFPTGEIRFDISNITENPRYLPLCNSNAPTNIYEGFEFITHCLKVATYLKDIYTISPINDETVRCKYLNYSINDVLKNNRKNYYNEEKFVKAYNILVEKLIKCNNSINSIEDSVFKKVQDLSNIYYKFNKYIKAINTYQTTDCEDVYNTVELFLSNLYRCRGYTNKFCIAVDNIKNNYLSNISQVNCENVKSKLKSFLTVDDTKTVKLKEESEAQPQAKQDINIVVEDERKGDMGTDVTALLSTTELVDGDNPDEPSNHNASNPVRIITYTSLGFILPLATLYRLTPLGSWVNTKILGKDKLMDNMKKNHYELLLNDVRNGEISLNDTTYSISYNSASK
ncbi:PIR protein [Plasmodium vivax]|nr:PIR protein [Plasmodium vivax]